VKLLKKTFYLITFLLISTFLYSCRTAFPEPDFAKFAERPNPITIWNQFTKECPDQLSMDQSALIGIGRKKITAIGLCSFNRDKDEISLALMTLTGMKLLEMERKNGKTETYFSISEITNKKSASEQLVMDIKSIYFQPTKRYDNCEIRKDKIIYKWAKGEKKTILIFGQSSKREKVVLLIKKQYINDTLESLVYYSDYKMKNGKNIPMTIHYQNRKFDYTLILKTKKIYL
jgi:hypothetical protein